MAASVSMATRDDEPGDLGTVSERGTEVDIDDVEVAFEADGYAESVLDVIPDEVLTEVLSFVPHKWLLNCALVCRAWRDIVNGPTLWKKMCLRTRRFVENHMAPYYPEDWREFYFKCPYTRNLVKNPSGKGLSGSCSPE